jgi:Flp pilus assembly CpaF family ATPase
VARNEGAPFERRSAQQSPSPYAPNSAPDLRAVPAGVSVDYELVRRLRREVGGKLAESRRRYATLGTPLAGDDERQLVRSLIDDATRAYAAGELAASRMVPADDVEALGRAVWSSMYEADQLQALLNDDSVETINVIGCDKTFIKYADERGRQRGPDVAASDEQLIELVRRLASWVGLASRPWDMTNPFLRLRLPDGSRLAAIGWVCERPTVSIRRNRFPQITLDDLVANRTCTREVADFLRAAVKARLTTFLAGDQEVGKTTLLRAMAAEIDPAERIFTIEESLELDLAALGKHNDVVALEARKAYGDSAGAVTLTDLVRETLTQDADRVIVGECRGPEVIALINATLGGSGGSLSTIHCKDAKRVFNRISSLAVQSKEAGLTSQVAHMLIAEALELCVFLKMVPDPARPGRRRRVVHEVIQVDGWNGDIAQGSALFTFDKVTDQAERGPAWSSCRFAEELIDAGWRPGGDPGWRV